MNPSYPSAYHLTPTPLPSRYIFTLEGIDTVVSASDPQPIVRIPARARHTFKVDDSYEGGPCTIEISTDVSPKAPGSEPEARGASSKL